MALREYRVWSDFDREQDDMRAYNADDVDALLTRIREAVAAERLAVAKLCIRSGYPYGAPKDVRVKWMDGYKGNADRFIDAAAALDALLSGEG